MDAATKNFALLVGRIFGNQGRNRGRALFMERFAAAGPYRSWGA
jgi:hypothetical protein